MADCFLLFSKRHFIHPFLYLLTAPPPPVHPMSTAGSNRSRRSECFQLHQDVAARSTEVKGSTAYLCFYLKTLLE
jgi:hypothetical protein